MSKRSLKVCGLAPAQAVAHKRPEAVARALLRRDRSADFKALLSAMAKARRPYRFVDDEELARFAGTGHHQGVCLEVAPPRVWRDADVLADAAAPGPRCWLYLDRVGNPHNLGAIARSAAHFGATALLTPDVPEAAGHSTAAHRTAKGGLEHIPLARLARPEATLSRLQRDHGHVLVATAADGEVDLLREPAPSRVVWLLGTEEHGLDARLRRLADATARIPGTGAVESLNVSVASALCVAVFKGL